MNKQINREIRRISNHSSLLILIYIVLSYVITFGLSLIFSVFKNVPLFQDNTFYTFVLYCAIYLVGFPIILLLFYKTRGRKIGLTLKGLFRKPQKSAGWCAIWIVIGIGLTYLTSVVFNIIFTIIEQLTEVTLYSPDFSFGNTFFAVLTLLLALPFYAPIFEELLFRGTLYRNNEPMGQWFAIIVSGITFGLWHTNYQQFFYTAVFGMFACFIFAKTRSIIPTMIMHFCFNTIGAIESLAQTEIDFSKLSENDIEFNMHYMLTQHPISTMIFGLMIVVTYALIIAGIILLVVQLAKHNGKAYLKKSVFNISNAKKVSVYFSAPITIVVFVLLIVSTVLRAMSIY
jgi:hypothetical protein